MLKTADMFPLLEFTMTALLHNVPPCPSYMGETGQPLTLYRTRSGEQKQNCINIYFLPLEYQFGLCSQNYRHILET